MPSRRPARAALALAAAIDRFVSAVAALPNGALPADAVHDLRQQAMSLTRSASAIDPMDPALDLSDDQKLMLRELRAGSREEERFDRLIDLAQRSVRPTGGGYDPAAAEEALVTFLKTPAGFDLMHKSDRSWEQLDPQVRAAAADRLAHILGGLDHVEAVRSCVLALRAERVGSILGYVLSHRIVQDMTDYEALPLNRRPDLTAFLTERIRAADIDALCHTQSEQTPHGAPVASVRVVLNERSGRDGARPRPARRADHCFVTQKTPTDPGVITFGCSFSDGSTVWQGDTYAAQYKALATLVAAPLLNGAPNPRFGAQIRPFYFYAGRFAVGNPAGSRLGMNASQALAQANVPHDAQSALAALDLLGVAFRASSADNVSVFFRFNHVVAGADTLNLHNFVADLAASNAPEPDRLRAITEFCGHQVGLALSALDAVLVPGAYRSAGMKEIIDDALGHLAAFATALPRTLGEAIDDTTHAKVVAPLVNHMAVFARRAIATGLTESDAAPFKALWAAATAVQDLTPERLRQRAADYAALELPHERVLTDDSRVVAGPSLRGPTDIALSARERGLIADSLQVLTDNRTTHYAGPASLRSSVSAYLKDSAGTALHSDPVHTLVRALAAVRKDASAIPFARRTPSDHERIAAAARNAFIGAGLDPVAFGAPHPAAAAAPSPRRR